MRRHLTLSIMVLTIIALSAPAFAMMGGGGGHGSGSRGGSSDGHMGGNYGGSSDNLNDYMMNRDNSHMGNTQNHYQDHMGATDQGQDQYHQEHMGYGQNSARDGAGQSFGPSDMNRDGVLDMNEFHRSFPNMTHQQFMDLDANQDGVLDHDEWRLANR